MAVAASVRPSRYTSLRPMPYLYQPGYVLSGTNRGWLISHVIQGGAQSDDQVWVIRSRAKFRQLWRALSPVDEQGQPFAEPEIDFSQKAVLVASERPTASHTPAPELGWMMFDPDVNQLTFALKRAMPKYFNPADLGGNPWLLTVVDKAMVKTHDPKMLFMRSF